jgi:hypothetical protein
VWLLWSKRLEEEKKEPQRGPQGGRVKKKRNAPSHFAELAKTPEGRAQLAEWRSRRKVENCGRPHGATAGVTRKTRNKIIAKAQAEAKAIVELMDKKGMIPKDEYAKEAIETVVELVRRTDIHPKDKLASARTLLEWTLAKPATEANVNLKKAEDFLDDLAAELKE